MLITLGEAKANSGLRKIAGTCPTNEDFTALVNESTSRLMTRGDFPGTIVPIHVCVTRGCVVYPRYVLQVRKMNVCRYPFPIKNNWYEFGDYGQYSTNRWTWGGRLGQPCVSIGQMQTPVFQDIMGDGRLVRFYARCRNDLGKTLKIFGLDNNGQPLMERDAFGTWTPGVTVTLTDPWGSTSVYVRSIERVLKEETECRVDGYGYDVATDTLENLVYYDGSETNPSYSKYQLNLPCNQNTCGTSRPIVALVKLRFIPAKTDDDLVLIDNMNALKDMFQCIKRREAGDMQGANEYEMAAIRELNNQLRNEVPDDQIPVTQGDLNGSCIGRQIMF